MARKEKFGKLVLLGETEVSLLGTDYRAAKLGPAGLDKIVTLLRLRPALSANSEAARSLMDKVKVAAQLQNPNLLRIFGIGKVESTYYITYEFVEGRSLRQVLDRCREEGYPFAVDHALLIASKVAAALEYVHPRKTDGATRMFHGLLAPATVVVSYEGEVRLKCFGYWQSRVREEGLLLEAEQRYLAPEQAAGGFGDTRSDLFGLGAILFETLTGQAPPAGSDSAALMDSARLTSPSGDDESLPMPLAKILQKALALDPTARYGEIAEMRKDIDTLLFAGDFTPTTFNLAFFMHSLFRDDLEREAKTLKDEREASYAEYLAEEVRHPATPAARPAGPPDDNKTEPFDPKLLGLPANEPPPDLGSPESALIHEPVPAHEPMALDAHPPQGSSPGFSSKEAASSFTFHKDEPKKGKAPALLGGVALLLLGAAGASYYYFFFMGRPPAAPAAAAPQAPATLSPDAVAAQERVKELEEKLQALEAEKQAAEAKAADDAKSKVEAQAKAKGQEVDQAAVLRAEDEARQKTRKEQDRKQQEELKRLEDQRQAEEARLAEERRRAEELAAAQRAAAEQAAQAQAAAQTPPPTTAPEPPPTTAPPAPVVSAAPGGLRPGALVNLADAGVIAPILEKKPQLAYPPIALRQRVEGTIALNLLVDERGNVVDAQVQSGGGGRSGLSESAVDYAKRWKYRPATKDGVPVKVWTEVKVVFKLPAQ